MSKWLFILGMLALFDLVVVGQEVPAATEQSLEELTMTDDAETEDDSYLQALDQYRRNPVNINEADETTLQELLLLTDLQIQHIISHRRLLGNFLSIYELQAVPVLDIATIKNLLPFITIGPDERTGIGFKEKMLKGDHSFLLRVSSVIERARGYAASNSGNRYAGSPQRFLFRYRYNYKNLLQYGLIGDKDAGERFFGDAQKAGFDFYSFHFFARNNGKFKAIALGDFTVNMGQGLIHWQSLGFKKNADALAIKRQSQVLRPYSSAGEFNFHRGAGVTIRLKPIDLTAFVSYRKLSANLAQDSVTGKEYITSFLMSGHHRTVAEQADRNVVDQLTFGGNVSYRNERLKVGMNAVHYILSHPVQKREQPYNLYAITGDRWFNGSVDYSYTYKNFHFFGEAAIDKNLNKAFLHGLLLSPDARIDLSLLYRHISPSYQSLYGNAFTENVYPSNEKGLYAGMVIRPSAHWRLDAYADIFKFPWLKYLVDAPSGGREYMGQLSFSPSKQVTLYSRYRIEQKEGNDSEAAAHTRPLTIFVRQNWRTHLNYKVNKNIELRSRTELSWYGRKGDQKEPGFLVFTDLLYRPMARPLGAGIRLQYFETESYNSRLYAYENDVLYSYSIPVFYGKGYRYYLNINYELKSNLVIWIRWAQTFYIDGRESIGTGLDEISGNKRSEWKLQLRWVIK